MEGGLRAWAYREALRDLVAERQWQLYEEWERTADEDAPAMRAQDMVVPDHEMQELEAQALEMCGSGDAYADRGLVREMFA
jgi:hypothetical protein